MEEIKKYILNCELKQGQILEKPIFSNSFKAWAQA